MKRVVVIVVLAFTLSLIFYSCKSSEHCPAYGQAKTNHVSKSI